MAELLAPELSDAFLDYYFLTWTCIKGLSAFFHLPPRWMEVIAVPSVVSLPVGHVWLGRSGFLPRSVSLLPREVVLGGPWMGGEGAGWSRSIRPKMMLMGY
jgi:hypothetical protein